jgi:hypothetical protein
VTTIVCVGVKFFKEKCMEKLAILLFVVGSLLAGCVAYDDPYYNDGRVTREHDRDRYRDRDRDRDGVPNSQDRRPDDPRRY